MHDIKQLEQMWEIYQKKRRKPYYIYALLAFIFMIIGYYVFIEVFSFKKESLYGSTKEKEVFLQVKSKTRKNHFLLNPALTQLEDEKKIPSNLVSTLFEINHSSSKLDKVTIPTLPFVRKIPIKEKRIVETIRKKIHFNIIKSSSDSAYLEVEKRFNQFRDPNDSLFLAKMYYEKNEYKKSAKWALQTNKINNSIEESWIIFAKSKIKLGKINDAIHILTTYIDQSDSNTARILLLKISK